ncbi:hypothetical protein [Apibacter muscae]|uniref:hypothetical protein n=1 Tax=Apibacter muscae TaxID=2509004 RepID=UPI0021AAB1F0|nr:hypothetical protein [Apibacter muscae]
MNWMYFLFLFNFIFISAQQSVEKSLKRQLEFGSSIYNNVTDIAYYKYDKNDVDASFEVISKILNQNGYKQLSVDSFTKKVKNIFGDLKQFGNILFLSKQYKCLKPTEIQYFDEDGFSLNIYFDLKNGLMVEQYKLPELIDYQKEYPEISKIENTLKTKKVVNGDSVFIQRWKDVPDLAQQRRFNKQLLVSRNKYLFNDDKSQFVWLTNNDEYFMRSLVTTFGYTEDKKLLNWVIENTDLDLYSLKNKGKFNYEEFGSLFWTKKCNGVLKLHPNTFKLLQELYKPNDNSTMRFLLDNIKEYLNYLFNDKIYNGILTKEERLKIGANLVYFAEQYKYNTDYNSNERMMGRLRYFLDDDSVGILMKNNYYNLPKFKQWWDKALYDQDYVIECEYDGVCGRDNPGPDPRDPKYKNSF